MSDDSYLKTGAVEKQNEHSTDIEVGQGRIQASSDHVKQFVVKPSPAEAGVRQTALLFAFGFFPALIFFGAISLFRTLIHALSQN
jgi:hypothetical protein